MDKEIKTKIISWVKDALKQEKLDKIDVKFPVTDATGGYSAEIVYVDVRAEKGLETKCYNLIVKKNKDNEVIMDTMNFREVYKKEVYLYSTYVPFLKKFAEKRGSAPFDNIPRCYGTVNETNHYVIVMENLKPKNFRCHPLGGDAMSLDHVKLVITAYAKWHALGLAVRDQDPDVLKGFGKPRHLLENEYLMKSICASIENEMDYVSEIYKKNNDLKPVEVLQKLKENYVQMFRDMLENKDEDVLIARHGDSWNNNFLFHFNEEQNIPDKVMIIDWQAGILGNPMADVNQFLFYCCTRKELEHLDEILKLYHDTLSKKLKELGSDPSKCFPWDVCKKSFERYAPLSIAGVPICSRMCFKGEVKKAFDFADSVESGNVDAMFGNELTDPKKYFERIDGVLKLVIDRKLV
ncbi:uncharacterized protein LOC123308095 [Coccinella septempunctata]|uniref:uncharacterized protein LOC123308095 n=1 Tax=Coccinella septempunctata TaxID=41139 RepID=UPI001D068A4E|nr:uncharacterized protein LOC123308095 [Coccinella septempunctata]